MTQVTISPKFQVVIPQAIREKLSLQAGQKMCVIAYDDKVIFIPVRPIQASRGSAKGINTQIDREDEDRL